MARNTLVFGFGLVVALLLGWVAFPRVLYSRQNQPVAFHHKTHAEKSGSAQCSDCHALASDGKFAGIPSTESCAGCHAEPMGTSPEEAVLVNSYIKSGKAVPWKVYARQPANVWFSHAIHIKRAGMECKQCHSSYGTTDELRVYEQNRISGYSRDIWGHSISRIKFLRQDGMKMSDCEDCHRKRQIETSCFSCHQ